MRISVIGTGYVGLSLSVLLSQKHEVTAIDIIQSKIDSINNKKSPIVDKEIQDYLSNRKLNLIASTDYASCRDSEFVILALPTNYCPETNYFDTSILENGIKSVLEQNPDCTLIIKSTIPIGYTKDISEKMGLNNLIFSPEFLREGRALYDNLHPSRIVVGTPSDEPVLKEKARKFAELLKECADEDDIPMLIIGSTEAESIKLFSNTYLAMRVSYFNELDSFAEKHSLNSEDIIKGVCLDPRIGDNYNNPSLGYGGYCLPKDTKQLRSNYLDVPNSLIKAIVDSNRIRKEFIVEQLIARIKNENIPTTGIYRLTMKSGSDNFRESSIIDILRMLSERGVDMVVYEPTLSDDQFEGFKVVKELEDFKNRCGIIIANRYSSELDDVKDRVYCRDVFMRD